MTDRIDVRRLRADTLTSVLSLARALLTEASGHRTLYLGCAQFYADEAGDAVHDTLLVTRSTLPDFAHDGAGEGGELDEDGEGIESYRVDWSVASQHVRWDDNDDAVYAFAPLCHEEGWAEGEVEVEDYSEGGTPSSLLVVQRVGGELRATWLGALHRPWLDFPGAMSQRDNDWNSGQLFVEDPPPMPLEGREAELYAQVLADPDDHGARDVLRDLWMQRDDPRGELAALSASPRLSPAERARAAELVLAHGRAWLGPLQAIVPLAGALFGYGPFAKQLVVYARDAETFARVADAPEWATVERLVFANTSYRGVTRAMKGLRAVGPITVDEAEALAEGSWRVEELDVELVRAADLYLLADLALPLRRLALRLEDDGGVDLGPLQEAAWWPSLARLELWLPGSVEAAPAAIDQLFDDIRHLVPAGCTLAVGQLAAGQRSGWLLAGDAQTRRLELLQPDARYDQGARLALQTGLALPDSWEPPAGDDWLTFGLGVAT